MYAHKAAVIFLVGPTAVGKTALSIELAKALDTEIISADSRLLYRGMDIGTAKPSAQERADVRHHLIDVAEPDAVWSLGRYKEAALGIIVGMHERGQTPLVVGGTGQYIRALTQGWAVPEIPADEGLRAALAHWSANIGSKALHAKLTLLDPKAAEKIDHRNVRRTIRALEVIFKTGRRFSTQRGKAEVPYQATILGLTRPRDELYARVDTRIAAMLGEGFEDEVRGLLARYPANLPPFSAIGYREMIAYFQGETSLEEAVALMKRHTRQFVRRQANWFKPDDPHIYWIDMSGDALDKVLEAITMNSRESDT
jgi:tRNA dimethylallyltransferase